MLYINILKTDDAGHHLGSFSQVIDNEKEDEIIRFIREREGEDQECREEEREAL